MSIIELRDEGAFLYRPVPKKSTPEGVELSDCSDSDVYAVSANGGGQVVIAGV